MEQAPTPQLHLKSQDQLRQTLEVVNLERTFANLPQYDTQQLAESATQGTDLYDAYVADVRQLRQKQKASVVTLGDTSRYDSTFETDLKADLADQEFSPSVVKALIPFGESSYMPVLSSEHIVVASKSFESLMSTVKSLEQSSALELVSHIENLVPVVGEDEASGIIRRYLGNSPTDVVRCLELADRYLAKDEVANIINEACDAGYGDCTEMLLNKSISPRLSKEQADKLVATILDNKYQFLNGANAGLLVEAGYVDAELAADMLVENFASSGRYHFKDNAEFLGNQGRLAEVKRAYLKYVEKTGIEELGSAMMFDLLTPQDKKELVTEYWQKDPTALVEKMYYVAAEYIPSSELRPVVEAYVSNPDTDSLQALHILLRPSHETPLFELDETQQLVRDMLERNPTAACHELYGLKQLLGKEEIKNFMLEHAAEFDINGVITMLESGRGILDFTIDEQRAVLSEALSRDGDISMGQLLVNDSIIQKVFSREELTSLVDSSVANNLARFGHFSNAEINDLAKFYQDNDKVLEVLSQVLENRPSNFFHILRQQYFRYDKSDLQAIIVGCLDAGGKKAEAFMSYPEVLSLCLEQDQVYDVMKIAAEKYPIEALNSWQQYRRFLSESQANDLAEQLVRYNPANAWLRGDLTSKVNQAWMLEAMHQDTEITSLAPAWFRECFKKFEKSSESNRCLVMNDASVVYQLIKQVDSAVDVAFLQQGKSAASQRTTLMQLALIGKEGANDVVDDASLHNATRESLGKLLGVTLEASEMQALENMMFPFGVYALQFAAKPNHQTILAAIAKRAGDPESLKAWRFGESNEAGLTEMKTGGLLPENLTIDQHKGWVADESLELADQLGTTPKDVRDNIRKTISENIEQLGIATGELALNEADQEQMDSEIAEAGKQLAQLHKEIVAARSLPEGESPSKVVEQLVAAREAVVLEQSRLQFARNMIKLWSLSDEEIKKGNLVSKTGKDGLPISKLIQKLSQSASKLARGALAPDVLGRISTVVDNYYEEGKTAIGLVATDTSDMRTILEIGAKPVGSCQHYANGQFNGALLGYTEPGVKAIVVKDKTGNIVARSILRLMGDEESTPGLHVETIYTQTANPTVAKAVYSLAVRKAKILGVRAFISKTSQNQNGEKVDFQLPVGLSAQGTSVTLATKSMRAPFGYCDSAGGVVTPEGFKLEKLAQLSTI